MRRCNSNPIYIGEIRENQYKQENPQGQLADDSVEIGSASKGKFEGARLSEFRFSTPHSHKIRDDVSTQFYSPGKKETVASEITPFIIRGNSEPGGFSFGDEFAISSEKKKKYWRDPLLDTETRKALFKEQKERQEQEIEDMLDKTMKRFNIPRTSEKKVIPKEPGDKELILYEYDKSKGVLDPGRYSEVIKYLRQEIKEAQYQEMKVKAQIESKKKENELVSTLNKQLADRAAKEYYLRVMNIDQANEEDWLLANKMKEAHQEFDQALKLFSELQKEYKENKRELIEQEKLESQMNEVYLQKENEALLVKLNELRSQDYLLQSTLRELKDQLQWQRKEQAETLLQLKTEKEDLYINQEELRREYKTLKSEVKQLEQQIQNKKNQQEKISIKLEKEERNHVSESNVESNIKLARQTQIRGYFLKRKIIHTPISAKGGLRIQRISLLQILASVVQPAHISILHVPSTPQIFI